MPQDDSAQEHHSSTLVDLRGIEYEIEVISNTDAVSQQQAQKTDAVSCSRPGQSEQARASDARTLDGEKERVTLPNDIDRAVRLERFGDSLVASYQRTGFLTDLNLSIQWFQQAVNLTPQTDSNRAHRLHLLGSALILRHQRTPSLEDITVAIQLCGEAVGLTPKSHSDRADRLGNLGAAFYIRYQYRGVSDDLHTAVELYQLALNLTEPDSPTRSHRLDTLGTCLRVRYQRFESLEDLQTSINYCQEALDLTPHPHLERASRLQNIGMGFRIRYKRTGALVDLNLAIRYHREALNLTPQNHPDRARQLHSLSGSLMIRYQYTASPEDIAEAIQNGREALDLTSQGHPDRSGRLHDLGAACHIEYERSGALPDLEEAVRLCWEAVQLTQQNSLTRAHRLGTLGTSLRVRFQRTGSIDDLNDAIRMHQQALKLMPQDHPERANRLRSLSIDLRARYRRTGALEDLEVSIQYCQEALKLTPSNHPDRPGQLHSLGSQYQDFYQRNGMSEDLIKAIQRFQEALESTPIDHSSRAARVRSLGLAYHDRYLETRALGDLTDAVKLCQEALDATPEDHPERPARLGTVGVELYERYRRSGNQMDLIAATQRIQEALNLMPVDHLGRTGFLGDLGIACLESYRKTGSEGDLTSAIQYHQEALSLTPENHPDQPDIFCSLGIDFRTKYQKTGVRDDLETSIQYCQHALDLTPQGHPDRTLRVYHLAAGYRARYEETREPDDLNIAIQHYEDAVIQKQCPTMDRLRSCRTLLKIYTNAREWSMAYKIASLAVSLIPLLAPLSLNHSDKQYLVSEIVGLASDAAAVTIKAGGAIFDAIRLLELGRGIVGGSLSAVRTDVADLEQLYPDLAKRFRNLCSSLDTAKPSKKRTQRYDIGQELNKVIQKIRATPEFSHFLLGLHEEELAASAISSPVVIVNLSQYGCHAFIIEQNETRVLELPLLKIEDVKVRADELANPDVGILEWLWDTVAEPILKEIGFIETPKFTWPRISWILTGLLAQFPIHAAGYYSDPGCYDTVMDRVISSYNTSLRAILNNQRNRVTTKSPRQKSSMVLVGMPQTPGHRDLQFAAKEIRALADLDISLQIQVQQPLPFRKDTLYAIGGCDIFHFAGHGYTDVQDPSQSALILKDGRLTVQSIFEKNFNFNRQKPFLAYLSACGTGQIKHEGLLDEGLHLIGACQLAGFQHVIGTLWAVNDESCVEVAIKTYLWMQEHDMTNESVAGGLHHAIREIRDQWIEDFQKDSAGQDNGATKKGERSSIGAPKRPNSKTRAFRDGEIVEDPPLHWVPYAHFGM